MDEACVTNVVTESGTVFEGEAEPTELVGVYEVSAEDGLAAGAEGTSPAGSSPSTSRSHAQADPYGENPMKRRVFDREQSAILERFYENGMNSTHRRNKDIVDEAAREVGVSADKVKNWIGAETVRRKRHALHVVGAVKQPGLSPGPGDTPPAKRKRSMSGYNMFMSEAMKEDGDVGQEHKEDLALRWRNMSDEDRLEWHQRARAMDMQKNGNGIDTAIGVGATPVTPVSPVVATTASPSVEGRDRVVSYAVSLLQSCLERLDQVGVHSYCLLVDPIQMKTHTLASALGQQFHQQQQQQQQLSQQGDSESSTAEGNGDGASSGPVHDQNDLQCSPSSQGDQSTSSSENLSVYTAFSRYVLSTALAQQNSSAASSVSGADATSPVALSAVTSPTGNACRFQTPDGFICPYVATSPHFLRAHRQDTGHHAKRGRPRKNPPPSLNVAMPSMNLPSLNLDAVASLAGTQAGASHTTTLVTTDTSMSEHAMAGGQSVSDLSIDHMVMLVRNTFNAKYEAVTGVKSVPFDDVRALEGVTIYGLPDGVSLQRPRSYTPEQLHAIVKELGKVVFLPAGSKNASSQHRHLMAMPVGAQTPGNRVLINPMVASVGHMMPVAPLSMPVDAP